MYASAALELFSQGFVFKPAGGGGELGDHPVVRLVRNRTFPSVHSTVFSFRWLPSHSTVFSSRLMPRRCCRWLPSTCTLLQYAVFVGVGAAPKRAQFACAPVPRAGSVLRRHQGLYAVRGRGRRPGRSAPHPHTPTRISGQRSEPWILILQCWDSRTGLQEILYCTVLYIQVTSRCSASSTTRKESSCPSANSCWGASQRPVVRTGSALPLPEHKPESAWARLHTVQCTVHFSSWDSTNFKSHASLCGCCSASWMRASSGSTGGRRPTSPSAASTATSVAAATVLQYGIYCTVLYLYVELYSTKLVISYYTYELLRVLQRERGTNTPSSNMHLIYKYCVFIAELLEYILIVSQGLFMNKSLNQKPEVKVWRWEHIIFQH